MRTFRPVIIHDGNGQVKSNILPFYRQGRLPHETAFSDKTTARSKTVYQFKRAGRCSGT